MLPPFPARLSSLVVGLLLTCVVFYTSFHTPIRAEQVLVESQKAEIPPLDALRLGSSAAAEYSNHSLSLSPNLPIQNATLGFQEIYMISLPERTDKQDTFAMQAAFSGISYNQRDGVYGNEVPAKALPHVRLAGSRVRCGLLILRRRA